MSTVTRSVILSLGHLNLYLWKSMSWLDHFDFKISVFCFIQYLWSLKCSCAIWSAGAHLFGVELLFSDDVVVSLFVFSHIFSLIADSVWILTKQILCMFNKQKSLRETTFFFPLRLLHKLHSLENNSPIGLHHFVSLNMVCLFTRVIKCPNLRVPKGNGNI